MTAAENELWTKVPMNVPIPHPTPRTIGIEEFNRELKARLDEGNVRTLGRGPLTDALVVVGNTLCRLSPETTGQGAIAYVGKAASAGGVYSVVRSSKSVVRRLVPGRSPERIPGFYLYTESPLADPQVVAPVGPSMDYWDIAMLILEAVAVLHRRGHQRLRIFPNISGSGMYWRTRVVDVDSARFPHGDGWPVWDSTSFAYTTADVYNVGGMLVDSTTSPAELADHILSTFPSPERSGNGRDWMYAGWYVEMLESAHRNRNLPVGDEGWVFRPDRGNRVDAPPPIDLSATRLGASGHSTTPQS